MTALRTVVLLSDLDALIHEGVSIESRGRLKKHGLEIDSGSRLQATRARLAASMDRRWLLVYERARQRYGRGVAAVRDRVCSGCFVTLPTTARPRNGDGGALHLCESCGRILYWT